MEFASVYSIYNVGNIESVTRVTVVTFKFTKIPLLWSYQTTPL